MYVVAIIAAAGRGERLGAAVPKQLIEIGGTPILQRAVDAFVRSDRVDEVIVAVPPALAANPPEYLRDARKPLRVVAGGDRRQDSVARGFEFVSEQADIVVIHDGARPFVSGALIERTIDAAAEFGAAVAATGARDTVKQAGSALGASLTARAADVERNVTPLVEKTLPRGSIFLAQTPQAFRRAVLGDAIARGRGTLDATDEAMLVEQAGHPVRLVEGERQNIKITTPEDLAFAERLFEGARPPSVARIGTGYDLHRLAQGRPLILGGVTIPSSHGLTGHSDADALCHAVTDAILGAAAEGDIGSHFPDTDPTWKDASSIELLRRAAAHICERGFAVANIDAVVIAERPRLLPYLPEMRRNLAGAIGAPLEQVSVKGKTNEGVGELGRGEAIAVHAVALLTKR